MASFEETQKPNRIKNLLQNSLGGSFGGASREGAEEPGTRNQAAPTKPDVREFEAGSSARDAGPSPVAERALGELAEELEDRRRDMEKWSEYAETVRKGFSALEAENARLASENNKLERERDELLALLALIPKEQPEQPKQKLAPEEVTDSQKLPQDKLRKAMEESTFFDEMEKDGGPEFHMPSTHVFRK